MSSYLHSDVFHRFRAGDVVFEAGSIRDAGTDLWGS
jgi:hypothetical protein